MDLIQIILISIGGLIVLIGLFILFLFNRLVSLHNRIKNAWSGIDNQLKRRNDLIPNLVEIVKSYADYEKETLNSVIEARNKLINSVSTSDESNASDELSNALTHLFAVAEAYPDLKANRSFERLQVELVGTEDKIAYARQFYNDCVQLYNEKLLVFPNNIFATYLKFTPKEYFKATEQEKELVKVDFEQ